VFSCNCKLFSLLIVFYMAPLVCVADDATDSFKQGIAAFDKKDFQHAIDMFQQAKSQGFNKPSLIYNLGVSYYKIGDYKKAEQEFLQLTKDPSMSALAFYNLGLTAAKQNDDKLAVSRFKRANEIATNPKIKNLSAIAINRYSPGPTTRRTNTQEWKGLVSGTIAHDSNVTLDDVGSLVKSDNYLELIAAGGRFLQGEYKDGYRLGLSTDILKYSTQKDYDFKQLHADIAKYIKLDQWYSRAAVQYNDSWLGTNGFLRILGIEFRGDKKIADQTYLRLRYRYDNLSSKDTRYDYLKGNRQRFRIESRFPLSDNQFKVAYELEINNRHDFTSAVPGSMLFRSYSPTRHILRAKIDFSKLDQWQPELTLRYRISDYSKDYVSTTGVKSSRTDNQTQIGFGISRKIEKQTNFVVAVERTTNNSTMSVYDYDRNVFSASIVWKN